MRPSSPTATRRKHFLASSASKHSHVGVALPVGLILAFGVSSAAASENGFPGRNGKIALEEIKLVGNALYGHVATLNANGSGYRVHRPGIQLGRPRWSPDGKRLVVSSGILGEIPSSIRIMNANGSGLKVVVGRAIQNRMELSVASPDWLPDGRIAFLGYNLGNKGPRAGIYTIKPDGTLMRRVVRLTDLPPERGGPTLTLLRASPDGRRFAFVRHGDGPAFDLYSMKANGSGMRRLARGCWYRGLSLDWSPNSKRLLAGWTDLEGGCGDDSDSGIFILSPTGGTPKQIFTEPYVPGPPGQGGDVGGCAPRAAFSSDGRTIVFAVHRDPNRRATLCNELLVMSATGGGTRVIREAPENFGYHAPSMQPLRR